MSQNLAMPLNTSEITVGYKNYAPGYKINDKPAIHYEVDFKGKTYKKTDDFCASGDGIVMGVNETFIPKDQRSGLPKYTVGRWVAVKYYDVEGYGDLIVRYYHLASVKVKKGDTVNLDTILGEYGSSGDYCYGKHIHAEVDTDTTYWNYTPTISAATACGLKPGYTGAKDTTVNPLLVFKLKLSEPEKQTCTVTNDGAWCKGIDVSKIGTFR